MLARSWPVLAHVGAMLRILGSKMAAKMAISAIKNAKMSQDGAQEAAKLSQDGILGSKLEAFTSILASFLVPSSWLAAYQRFFEVWGVQYGSKIEENSLKMTLGRSWGSLGGYFERYWLEVGLSWLMLVLCCAFWAARWLPRWPFRRSRTPR